MSEAEVTALTERQRYWLEQVQACEASGKTIAEYAAEHDLAAPVVGSEWCIRLPNGVSVAFSGSVDAVTLTTVLNTAATLG